MKKTQKLILLFVEDISLAKAKTKMCVVVHAFAAVFCFKYLKCICSIIQRKEDRRNCSEVVAIS